MKRDLAVWGRWGITSLAVGSLALLAGACERPLPTDGAAATVPLRITAVTVGTPISTLVVQVTASDIPNPLVFNLTVVNSVASGTIKIPPGPARTIDVTAMDAQGNVTHEGSATLDVRPGQNPPLQIKLGPRSGHVPITVTFGNFGVVVTPATATINVPVAATLQLAVTVTDVNGQVLAAPAVGWATTSPAVGSVSATGLVTGVTNGIATIVATYEGVAGLSEVTVVGTGAGVSRIAFASNRDGNFEVYAMNADGTGQTNLSNNPASDLNPRWSPDGSRIAFISGRDGNAEIYVMNTDGSSQTNLSNSLGSDSYDLRIPWSPDGSKLAFVSDRNGFIDIFRMNADGSNQIALTNDLPSDQDPEWSPDGSKIAFWCYCGPIGEGGTETRPIVINADGFGRTVLAASEAYYPTWSPDGSRIAFQSGLVGDIIEFETGTGLIRNLTNSPGFGAPFWSPDGSKIAAGKNRDIYVMNPDGTGLTNLTNHPATYASFAWSPDGSKIAFASDRDGNYEIYAMNADGTGLTRLTNNPAQDSDPSWAP